MPLILNGTTGVSGVDGTAGTPAIKGGDTDTGIVYGTNTVQLATNGAAAVTVDASQNVGIGTTSPGYKLTVSGNISTNNNIILSGAASNTLNLTGGTTFNSDGASIALRGSATGYNNTGMEFYAGGSERARIDSSGNISINGTSALNGNAKLSIWNSAGSSFGFATGYGTGTSQFRLIYLTSAANALNFDNGANNATLSSAGAWTNASDAKLKKNIQDIQYGLSAVLEAKPRSFNRVDVDGDYIGFVAQELETIIPEVVWANDKNLTVDYGSLVAVAFKAIQELSAKLDAAEARIAALEAK